MTTPDSIEPSNQFGFAVVPPIAEPETRDVSVRALLAPVHDGLWRFAENSG